MAFCMLYCLQSCTKTPTESVVETTVDDTVWAFSDSTPAIIDSLDKPVIVDSFNCFTNRDNENIITKGDSLIIEFPSGGCMTSPNQPSTTIKKSTKIKSEIRLIKTRGDLIKYHLSSESNGNLIALGAFINIKLTYNGREVFWSPFAQIKMLVRANNTTEPMTYFSFQPSSNTSKDSTWMSSSNANPFGFILPYKDNQKRNWYQINSTKAKQFGFAYYQDPLSQQTKTRLNVFMPLKYTNKNTLVYAVFDKYISAIRLKANSTGKSYGIAGIPVNSKITIVTISKIKGVYYLGANAVTVTDSKPFTVTPNQIDSKSLNSFLKAL